MKKEYILQGLGCAHCSNMIEQDANKIEGVEAHINFAAKTLKLKINSAADEKSIIKEIKALIYKHEPGIIIMEKAAKNEISKTYRVMGLCCADCGIKIQTGIENIYGVKKAVVDYEQKKLFLQVNNAKELNRITNEAAAISKEIVPGIDIKNLKEKSSYDAENNTQKKELARLAAGAILFLAAITLRLSETAEFALFFASYLTAGGGVILNAGKNIIKGKVLDENFLMSIASAGAFLIGEFSEGAAVMLFYQIGEILQERAVDRCRRSISALLNIRPDYANIEQDGKLVKVPVEEVKAGTVITIKPGEKVPLDGVVLSGTSTTDTSALTGEALPRNIKTGDEILSGFININGLLTVKVTKEFGESTVYKIIDMVENAAAKKARTENFITKFAKIYTPVVVVLALFIALVPPLLSGGQFFEWAYRALTFLVISCPCALVISIPLGFFMGIGAASKNGILIKGSNYLEALCKADTIVFDKTGTLTKGIFKVTSLEAQNGFTKQELLKYAAYAESYSTHPVAESILTAYSKETDKNKIIGCEERAGKGVIANVEGNRVLAGNYKLLEEENISFTKSDLQGTVVYVAINGQFAGTIVISDEIKQDSYKLIKELKKLSIQKTVMLTGDIKNSAERVSKELGINEVYAELLPADKLNIIEKLTEQKKPDRKIIFAGDGINDAPALARADISVAMGALGSDAAIEAADIVIMTDEPSKIASAISIAKYTKKIIWQNIIFALAIKAIFLLLGSLGMADMWEAVFADVGVTLIAILNSLRALRPKIS